MEPLTQRQNEGYEYIRSYQRENNKPPTLSEIGEALGISSSNGVFKLLQALERKGYIRRQKHAARGIELVQEPDDPFGADEQPILPVLSKNAGAHPEEPRYQPAGYLSVDRQLLRRSIDTDRCLVGRAMDDGMSGDGIRKDDLLLIEEVPEKQLQTDVLIAAFVRQQLIARRLEILDNDDVALIPSNRTYQRETLPTNHPEYHPVGRILGLIRTF